MSPRRVYLSTVTYDNRGAVGFVLASLPKVRDRVRRVSVVETLDGGTVVHDGGMAHGDRTFSFTFRPASKTELDDLQYLFDNYGTLQVSTEDGFYTCAPLTFQVGRDGTATLTAAVREKVA